MLTLKIPRREFFNEADGEFIYIKETTLQLEHSLISIAKWESKWEKAFLVERPQKTIEEFEDYVKCMTINQNVDPLVYKALTTEEWTKISDYINSKQSAAWFSEQKRGRSNETPTADLIYYWMVALNIPFECQKWHLNRLLTLIRVCSIKNTPPKKMSKNEILRRNAALNKARRAKYGSKG